MNTISSVPSLLRFNRPSHGTIVMGWSPEIGYSDSVIRRYADGRAPLAWSPAVICTLRWQWLHVNGHHQDVPAIVQAWQVRSSKLLPRQDQLLNRTAHEVSRFRHREHLTRIQSVPE